MHPAFEMPKVDIPAAFHQTAGQASEKATDASLGDIAWKHIYTDPQLQSIIAEALQAGPDALLAASRQREVQALANAVRSSALPQAGVALNTSPTALQNGQNLSSTFLGGLNVSWDLDLWGRYASAAQAAKSDLLAREASRHAIQASIVANTASLYYQYAALNQMLTVTERARDNQQEVLRLIKKLSQSGVASATEEWQQESIVHTTSARIPALKRQISEVKNALTLLMGRTPGTLQLASPAPLSLRSEVPAGLPSSLLERRPDLQQSIAQMQAAHARVNEAKAQFFPSISLTAVFGGVSTSLENVLSGQAARVASLGPSLLLPLYTGNALQSNEKAALARLDQSIISYRKNILLALGEVSDSLQALSSTTEVISLQAQRVKAAKEVLRLAELRFSAGTSSFVEILDAQRQLLAAETDEVQSQLDRDLAWIKLYLTLGGGWSQTK